MNAEAAVNRLLDVASRRGLRRPFVPARAVPVAFAAHTVLTTPHPATQPNPPRRQWTCKCCGARHG